MVEGKKNLPGEAERFNMTDGFERLDDLITQLLDTEEWVRLQGTDSYVQAVEGEVHEMLDGIRTLAPGTRIKLQDAISLSITARDSAAVLYGMRIAMKLAYAFTHPIEMSEYFNTKWKEAQNA